MARVTIYHNPRCSKSRQTLQLLRDHGVDPEIVLYLESPPDVEKLREISAMLGVEPVGMTRLKDRRTLGLTETDDPDTVLRQMSENPKIIERPIVVVGNIARVGRPPERVLEIL